MTEDPLTDATSPVGGPGMQAASTTVITTSLEGALDPELFFARTRTKYVPAGTPLTVKVVAGLPVSNTAMFAAPDDEPASMTYDVAGSVDVDCSQFNLTVLLLTDADRFVDGLGASNAVTWPRSDSCIPLARQFVDANASAMPPMRQLQVVDVSENETAGAASAPNTLPTA